MARLMGHASVRGSSETMRMMLLTISTIGITFTWGVEMTYCTPYLLNLGLTKSNTSLVWVAGPLSGLIVQPIVGVIADESTSKWGRRRPLMVIGTAVVAASLLVLGFTKEIVGAIFGHEGEEKGANRSPTIVLAVLAIYVADFAINAVMSCSRSLVVDTLPIEKQQMGAAWASRMSAIGHLIGYAAGAIDMVGIFGTALGDTQFKQLTIIAAMAIGATTAITCWAVSEKVLVSPPQKVKDGGGIIKVLRQIYSTLLHLPPRIQAICWAQFWAWIGWFPFLFYSTTWVGETYFRYDAPAEAKQSHDALGDMGRVGSASLTVYSVITLVGALVLPLLVRSPDETSYTRRPPQAVAGLLERFSEMRPDLLTTWVCGHAMFATAMFLAPFATSFRFATVLVCLCGLPWTIASWAPTTFLGIEVNKLSSGANIPNAPYARIPDVEAINLPNLNSDSPASPRPQHDHSPEVSGTASSGELSGIYFGILNIYTTLPQFIGTFISSIVFAIMDPGTSPELATESGPAKHVGGADGAEGGNDGPNAIAVCLFIGAMSAVVAAFVTRRLRGLE